MKKADVVSILESSTEVKPDVLDVLPNVLLDQKYIRSNITQMDKASELVKGLFIILAYAGQGKTFVGKNLANFIDFDYYYANEPDSVPERRTSLEMENFINKQSDRGEREERVYKNIHWDDILPSSRKNVLDIPMYLSKINTSKFYFLDSMSIHINDSFYDDVDGFSSVQLAARNYGIPAFLPKHFTHVNQCCILQKRMLWITMSLSGFAPENIMDIFSLFQGFSNGVLLSHGGRLFHSLRMDTSRDSIKCTTILEVKHRMIELFNSKNVKVNGVENYLFTKQNSYLITDNTKVEPLVAHTTKNLYSID